MGEQNAELPVPVQLIVNTRARWAEWASAAGTPPPWHELIAQGHGDVAMLAQYALGHVQAAYQAGRAMAAANERAHALMLRGLDVLDAAQVQHAAALAQAAQVAAAEEASGAVTAEHVALVPAPDWAGLAGQALEYRQRALDELALATAEVAAALAPLDTVVERAARYEQGAIGVPPVVVPIQPGTGLRTT